MTKLEKSTNCIRRWLGRRNESGKPQVLVALLLHLLPVTQPPVDRGWG